MVKSFFQLKIHEHYSRDKILKLREKKFRKILKFAYHNSPFYHELYSSHGITEQDIDTINIEKIPSIDKDMLMKHFDKVVTVDNVHKKDILNFFENSTNPNELYKNKYHIIHTSGSSGKLGIFIYNKKEWDTLYPYIINVFDFNFRKNKSVFIGAVGGHFTGASFISWCTEGITRFFCESLILDVNDPLDEMIEKLNKFQPTILGGYFNALKVLAQKQEQGELHINPNLLTNCGEGITKKDKAYIERIFNASMSNLYSFAECYVLGFGKKEYDGIYLRDDLCLVEIMDDHLLITNLVNRVEPIIRYRIDDFVKEKNDEKQMLPFTLVDTIVGRAEFVIWFENEHKKMDFIHPLIFTDFYVNGLDTLQIAVESNTSFEFRAVITATDKERVKKQIAEKLDKILQDKHFSNVTYTIKEYIQLPVDKKTGKFRLIVDDT